MSAKPINKLFKIIGGKPAPKGENAFCEKGTPFVKMKDLGRAHFSNDLIDIEQRVSDKIAKANGLNLIKRGSILLPRSGSVALNHRAVLGVDAYMVSHICALEVIDENQINNLYAYYYLRSIKMDRISKKTTGLDAITFEDLGKIKIPLPPLDDQKRIAHLLGKVEGLIARRKKHLQQLDDLLKSVFLEMFGDPVRNEKGWEKKPFADLLDNIDSGKSPKCEAREADNDEWGVLKLGAVTSCIYKEDENKALPVEVIPNAKDEVKAGDLLFSRKNTYELVAACAYVFETRARLLLPDLIFRFVLKEDAKINAIFLWKLLVSSSQRKKIQALAGGAAGSMPNISKANLKQVSLPVPPIDFQNQFASIVEKVEHLKSRYQQSLTDLENLYGALSQKAFKGELDLSRAVLPVEATTEDADCTETHRKPKPLPQGFARQLLAAEILHRHNDRNMTQMKLQKLIHLVEYHARLDEIQGDYQRQAAGPFDNKMMYGIAAGLKKQQWFAMRGHGQNATYAPLLKASAHEKYLPYWQDKISKIDAVLQLLGTARPDQCEIVSTLYAAWNDLLIDGEEISDERIIEQASKAELWHKTKEAIDPDRWPKALQWMRDRHLVPTGYGKHTRKLP